MFITATECNSGNLSWVKLTLFFLQWAIEVALWSMQLTHVVSFLGFLVSSSSELLSSPSFLKALNAVQKPCEEHTNLIIGSDQL